MPAKKPAAAEPKPRRSNVEFTLTDSGFVEWTFQPSKREVTLEEAAAIGQIRGLASIAQAIDGLADAVHELAAAIRERQADPQ
jgi:hypothetical protein